MVPTDAPGGLVSLAVQPARRQRHDWVRVDVRCLMCGRLLGRLLGVARTHESGDRSAGHPRAFVAVRSLDPTDRVIPFSPNLRFKCSACGGAGALDEIDAFSTYDTDSALDNL